MKENINSWTISIVIAVVSVLATLWIASGDDMTFEDVTLNKDLPKDYTKRVLWSQTDAFKYDISQLAGHVIVGDKKTGEFRRGGRYLKPGYEPTVSIIDDGVIYNSKVDKTASSKSNYLEFAAGLDAKQTAEVTIADSSTVLIPWKQVPMDELVQENERQLEEGEERYYIQGVVLASVTIRNYRELAADASIIAGEAFGANGKIFTSTSEVSKDYQISLTLVSLRELALKAFSDPAAAEAAIVPADFTVQSISID
ncbi:hypothetical protein [uncultured Rubinisphaera sp.]|uniref:hypothetical protein n=1 Tax=uncultured Rubinisphaera sp. TaxID=1678686 RepID=UPI0030D798B4|tara:strand:+ start:739 stop:1503 length:765 start_codon:yes stop_codon:yes gene_type:complete